MIERSGVMLRLQNRLTGRQMKFLVDFRDEAISVEELERRHAITPGLVARWMRRSFFRVALRGVSVEKDARLVRLEVQQMRAAAWGMLKAMLYGQADRDAHLLLVCRAVVELGDVEMRRESARREMARRRRGKGKRPEARTLVHPDAEADGERLLATLEARGAAALLRGRPASAEEMEREIAQAIGKQWREGAD